MNRHLELLKCHFADEGYEVEHMNDWHMRVKKNNKFVWDIYTKLNKQGNLKNYTYLNWETKQWKITSKLEEIK